METKNNAAGTNLPLIVCLLWLCGVGLRLPVLSVPPVIPLLHDDPVMHLSKTGVGILSALPLLFFAWGAIPGSLLISKLGARRAVILGLAISTLGAALRGAAPEVLSLYAATAIMGFGIAVMQPSMPPLVRSWTPTKISFGTAVYSNGLVVGQIIVVWTTIPLVLPLLGGSWRWTFTAWAIPGALTVLLLLLAAPRDKGPVIAGPPPRWWPDWKSPLLWKLGLIVGGINTLYFATNAFLPDYLAFVGRPEQTLHALGGFNLMPLFASLAMIFVAHKFARKAWPFLVAALVMLAGLAGVLWVDPTWIFFSTGIIGFGNVFSLILAFALPAQLCPPEDVPRVSAGMFMISYSCAVVAMVLGGLSWDLTGTPYIALGLIGLASLAILTLAPRIDFRQGLPR